MSVQNLALAYQLVSALVRGTKILELLSRKSPPTMEAVSDQSETPRTSVVRILTTLKALGYVKRESVNVTGSLLSFADDRIEIFVEKVKQAARAASRKVGCRPSP